MPNTEAEIQQLDHEFSQLLQKLENFIVTYNFREKYLLTEWLTKLKNSKSSLEECKLRNRFLKHFVNNQVNVFLMEPFSKIPKDFSGPLRDLKKLLVRIFSKLNINNFSLIVIIFSLKILMKL